MTVVAMPKRCWTTWQKENRYKLIDKIVRDNKKTIMEMTGGYIDVETDDRLKHTAAYLNLSLMAFLFGLRRFL